jgi:dTDP-4-amino-4,6-dideoxygalactose transaminase
MITVPLFRPPAMDKELALRMISDAIDSKYIGEGPNCVELERQLASFLGHPRVLYMNSCTSALKLAFHLAGARPGTEVICTPMTCLATATAILETGASVVWADVHPETGNILAESVARMVRPNTVAVAAVDWGGRICNFNELREVTAGISLIEDAAHAFGANPGDKGRGDFICYSGQAIKHWTSADGGILVCPGAALFERARLLRWFGLDRTRGASMRCLQNVPEAGFKMQGNDILAAIGLASLVGIEERLRAHREHARAYYTKLSELRHVDVEEYDAGSANWFFGLKVKNQAKFIAHMARCGIEAGQVHARLDVQACFDGVRSDALPGLEAFSSRQVNIPCGSHLDDASVASVIQAVTAWGG